MFEPGMELRVVGIALVAHPLRGDSGGGKQGLLEIGAGRGPAEVAVGACGPCDREQPRRLHALRGISRVPDDPRVQPEQLCDLACEQLVDVREPLLLVGTLVPGADRRCECVEEWRATIGEFQRSPVLLGPGLFDLDLVDRLVEPSLGYDRNRQPFDAVGGLDPVAVVPVPLHILHAIENHVFVALPDKVEEAFPGNVAGLDDRNSHSYDFWGSCIRDRVYSACAMNSLPIVAEHDGARTRRLCGPASLWIFPHAATTVRVIGDDATVADRAERILLVLGDYRKRGFVVALFAALLLFAGGQADAQSLGHGISAFQRQDYMTASRVFIPLAERGNVAAQSYLGFLFETGRGVPQNYTEAAMWYRRAAEQGDSRAQYSLGLLYDRGQGVPQDIVEASKWLNLSTAASPPRVRESRARIRDAVTTKMTRGEIAQARLRALEWAPSREH